MADQKRRISGPGAADFLTAEGGEDMPGVSPSKGTTDVQSDAPLTDTRNLEPDLTDDTDAAPPNSERGVPRGRDGR